MNKKILAFLFVVGVSGTYAALTLRHRASSSTETEPATPNYAEAISRLDLSASQREQLTSCCNRMISTHEPLQTDLDRKLTLLRGQLKQPRVNQEAVSRLVGEISALRNQIFQNRVQAILEVRGTFTAKQMQTLPVLLEQRKRYT